MTKLSVLDLVPVREGFDVREAMANAADFAAHVESLGFARYWVAEHHGMPGIASAATAVVLAHVGHATSTIRIGAGGVMMPNHSTLQVAEQFGTLDAMFPGRVDLGLGRASGSDGRVAQALRRNLQFDPHAFPRDVIELQALLAGADTPGILATPGAAADVPLWILGSSLFGAQLAAALGLPFAFASHFAPDDLDGALATYRARFTPSDRLQQPYVMAGFNVFAADTRETAAYLATSMEQSFYALRFGKPGKLPLPVRNYRASLDTMGQKLLHKVLKCGSIGTQTEVERDLLAFVERTQADEVIISGAMHDPSARRRSFEIIAAAGRALTTAAMAA